MEVMDAARERAAGAIKPYKRYVVGWPASPALRTALVLQGEGWMKMVGMQYK